MSKKKKHIIRHNSPQIDPESLPVVWQDEKGQIHALAPGEPPTQDQLDEMSRIFQEQIKKSPLWQDMIRPRRINNPTGQAIWPRKGRGIFKTMPGRAKISLRKRKMRIIKAHRERPRAARTVKHLTMGFKLPVEVYLSIRP